MGFQHTVITITVLRTGSGWECGCLGLELWLLLLQHATIKFDFFLKFFFCTLTVHFLQGRALADKIGAVRYLECSGIKDQSNYWWNQGSSYHNIIRINPPSVGIRIDQHSVGLRINPTTVGFKDQFNYWYCRKLGSIKLL